MALKSKDQLMDAIFYAKEDPTKLFDILFPKVKDTSAVTSVYSLGDTTLKLVSGDSATTKAMTTTVLDQYGDKMSGQTITYSLKTPVTGCSVDSSTGVLTADSTAVADGKPIIVATCSGKTAELTVTLLAAT